MFHINSQSVGEVIKLFLILGLRFKYFCIMYCVIYWLNIFSLF